MNQGDNKGLCQGLPACNIDGKKKFTVLLDYLLELYKVQSFIVSS